jgi:glutamate-ammonia-ligase adenylyltransferase
VSETPDPDLALINLERVTASLGAKAVLWELFNFLPASLRLYVDLCANSPFLSEILINNPGMIDDLLDSLILNRPRTLEELRSELKELGRGVERAEVVEPILRSFQDKELLRIGVRDLLGKDDVRATTAALSDLAESLLDEVATRQLPAMVMRHGIPMLANGRPCRHALLALGKLGGREMSYHSDLDLLLVYEGDGHSEPPATNQAFDVSSVDNYEYFTELAQRIIRGMSQTGPLGRLYAVDMRLRPTGKSGSLALPMSEFERYFAASGTAQVWERQSLTRARVVHGESHFADVVHATAHKAVHGMDWRPTIGEEIRAMRDRLAASASPRSLKRGTGAMVDVEFLVQLFQIKYGAKQPALNRTNTWEALDALRDVGLLDAAEHRNLMEGYSFLRFAEARLRIVTNRPLNEYPESPEELEKFARRLGFACANEFLSALEQRRRTICEAFDRLTARERG